MESLTSKLYRLLRFDWPLHFILLFMNCLPDNVVFMRLRGFFIRPFFKKCGKNLRVGRFNIFYCSYNMEIGDDVYIAHGNWFNASTEIIVEDQVLFGPRSIFVTSNYSRHNGSFRYGESISAPIKVGFGSWIGGNCAILPGSEIGNGSVIGANSVVKVKVPDNCLFAGNPGEIKKRLEE